MAEAVEIIEDDPIEVRRAKREALIAAGVDPYGHSVKRSHSVGELNEKYAHLDDGESTEDEVLIAGRVMAKRVQGKIGFLELRESGCDIQLFCRINALGEEAFAALCDLDVGDWIAVHGTMMRTKRGQLSVAVDSFELMSKSLRPLPEKFHGLTDKETRYRQRYVDLVMNPEVRTTFERRFKIVSAIRRYMEGQGYYEVETPFLHAIIGGANAKPFITHFNALDRDYYLRIATELPLKRLLVGGFEKVFEIGRQFRNEGMDPYHNPEFTTMEAYEAFGDLDSMMDLTEGCIKAAAEAACGTLKIEYQGTPVDLSGDWRRASMMELASEHAGEEVSFDRTRDELVAILEKNGGHAEAAWGKGKLIAEIFEAVAEENIVPKDQAGVASPDEISGKEERLSDTFRLRLCDVLKGASPLAAVPEKFAELPAVVWRGDDGNLTDARQKENRQRIIDHRLIVDRQQLLADAEREGVKPRTGTARQQDTFP